MSMSSSGSEDFTGIEPPDLLDNYILELHISTSTNPTVTSPANPKFTTNHSPTPSPTPTHYAAILFPVFQALELIGPIDVYLSPLPSPPTPPPGQTLFAVCIRMCSALFGLTTAGLISVEAANGACALVSMADSAAAQSFGGRTAYL